MVTPRESFDRHLRDLQDDLLVLGSMVEKSIDRSMEALRKRVPDAKDVIERYDRGLRCIRTRKHKLIQATDGHHEFYDLDQGPEELENRYGRGPEGARPFEEKLAEWLSSFEVEGTGDAPDLDEDMKKRLEGLGYLL